MVYGKRSNPVVFLTLISIIFSFSSDALQFQTLLLRDDDDHRPQSVSSQPNPVSSPLGSAKDVSLSLEMIRGDNYRSPTANSTKMSRTETLRIRLKHDMVRVASLSSRATRRQTRAASSSAFSGVSHGSGEYLTRLGVGTPPKYFNMILDTGSDLTWLQCAPCIQCYKQLDPFFDPKKSKSYRNLGCESTSCQQLDYRGCNSHGNTCNYTEVYGDGSSTTGDFSSETLTMRRIKVKGMAIGCGHDNRGLFIGSDGLLGLGRGSLSFPNQAVKQYDRKFSYCLVSRGSVNKSSILFGNTSQSRKARFTPMLSNKKVPTFYYINLTGISVGGDLVSGITHSISRISDYGSGGGVVIDSGTVVTRLVESAYIALRDAFTKGASNLKRAESPIDLFDTCYDFSNMTSVSVPKVELHFDGGVNVDLPVHNFLVQVDDAGTYCFAFAPVNGLSIIGNIQQQGIRVSFDLEGERIGFTPNSC